MQDNESTLTFKIPIECRPGADLIFYPANGANFPEIIDFPFLGFNGAFDIQLALSKRTPLGINSASGLSNVAVYPNPNKGLVNIVRALGNQLKVYNVLEALVLEQTINSASAEINLSTFPSGIYRFALQNDALQIQSVGILKRWSQGYSIKFAWLKIQF